MSLSDEDEGDLMEIRERNVQLLKVEFKKIFGSDELEPINKQTKRPNRVNQRHKSFDIPLKENKPRRSERMKTSRNYEETDRQFKACQQPKSKRSGTPKIKSTREIPKVFDEVTPEDIGNISYRSSGKVYDGVNGSTCHQCRQKTKDLKTICRNSGCKGLRGQFCGFCLSKRYGENVADALKDSEWYCPVCRNICNCSLCRAKIGKPPTGILVPIIQQKGFKSVKEFLEVNAEIQLLDEG